MYLKTSKRLPSIFIPFEAHEGHHNPPPDMSKNMGDVISPQPLQQSSSGI